MPIDPVGAPLDAVGAGGPNVGAEGSGEKDAGLLAVKFEVLQPRPLVVGDGKSPSSP